MLSSLILTSSCWEILELLLRNALLLPVLCRSELDDPPFLNVKLVLVQFRIVIVFTSWGRFTRHAPCLSCIVVQPASFSKLDCAPVLNLIVHHGVEDIEQGFIVLIKNLAQIHLG